ncbi:MAG: EFR1 family ferrodoxin [Clostridia bacterium]|nr:EFR1 family ferrodoxin [Clostridia bacterium]
MKVILYVFSGTGNTLKVASLYKKYMNADVTVYRVSKKSAAAPSPEDYDLIGIGYPIHAFCAPEPILKFVKQLPKVTYRRTFVFKTSGEGLHINDCSSQTCIKILQKKGYDVTMERHVVMPYNMIYRHSDAMAKQMWIYAKAFVKMNCKELESFKRENVKQPFYNKMLVNPIGWIEQRFAHLHGPAFKVDKNKCIDCGKCEKTCPENNIQKTDDRYKFGHKCVLCMGCSFGCPVDAIHVGVFKYWKVNGSYRLEELVRDDDIPFPLVPDHARGIYRLYKKYYREVDGMLEEADIDVDEFVSSESH